MPHPLLKSAKITLTLLMLNSTSPSPAPAAPSAAATAPPYQIAASCTAIALVLLSALAIGLLRHCLSLRKRSRRLAAELAGSTLLLEQAHKQLQSATARLEGEDDFRSLAENATDGILIINSSGRACYANRRLSLLTGFSKQELLSFDPKELLGPVILEPHRDAVPGNVPEELASCAETSIVTKASGRLAVELCYGSTVWQKGPADLVMIRDISERKQAEAATTAHQLQLSSLAEQLSQAEERERRRIAEELHDNVCQTLALSSFRLSALSLETAPSELLSELAAIRCTIDASIDGIRSLTLQLCPPVLYDLGLPAALEWLSRSVKEAYGLEVAICNDAEPQLLFNDNRFTIFQMIRELLLNIVKHSGVNRAKLTLTSDHDTLAIVLEDAGAGFDPRILSDHSRNKGGFGLFNIQQRIGFLGGECCFDSEPGKGCRSILLIPISGRST